MRNSVLLVAILSHPLFIGSTTAELYKIGVSVYWVGVAFCGRLLVSGLCLLCICFWLLVLRCREVCCSAETPSPYTKRICQAKNLTQTCPSLKTDSDAVCSMAKRFRLALQSLRLLLQTLQRSPRLPRVAQINQNVWPRSRRVRFKPLLHQTPQRRHLRISLQQLTEVLLRFAGDEA